MVGEYGPRFQLVKWHWMTFHWQKVKALEGAEQDYTRYWTYAQADLALHSWQIKFMATNNRIRVKSVLSFCFCATSCNLNVSYCNTSLTGHILCPSTGTGRQSKEIYLMIKRNMVEVKLSDLLCMGVVNFSLSHLNSTPIKCYFKIVILKSCPG